MSILILQFMVTFGIVSLFVFEPNVNAWMRGFKGGATDPDYLAGRTQAFLDPKIYFVILAGIAALLLTVMIYTWESLRRKTPQNLILLLVLTVVYGVLVGSISAFFRYDN